jgi:glutathione S-transferase
MPPHIADEAEFAAKLEDLRTELKYWEGYLQNTQYLAGPSFTLADVYIGATRYICHILTPKAPVCIYCAVVINERCTTDYMPLRCAAPMLLSAQRYGAEFKTFPKVRAQPAGQSVRDGSIILWSGVCISCH